MQTGAMDLWTIGHSTRSIGEFMDLLRANGIEVVADVRRFPGSRRHPHFGQAALGASLALKCIEYFHLPELGGRRPASPDSINTAWRNEAFRGYADFMGTREFESGIDRLLSLAQERRTAIMCAEALWWQCHRSLIADHLKAAGHTVWHILGTNKAQLHSFSGAARILNGRLSYREPDPAPELPLR
jgi:uncharacterized protein (DUF488 family)